MSTACGISLSVSRRFARSALAAGQIDATTISIGVWLSMPDKSEVHQLVDQESFYKAAPFVTKLNVVTEEVAKTKSKQVAAVVRAHHHGLARLRQGSEALGRRRWRRRGRT